MTPTNTNSDDSSLHIKIPDEFRGKSGELLALARRELGLSREDIADTVGFDYTKIVKFEVGGIELTPEMWRAYVQGVSNKYNFDDMDFRKASALLRGLTNEKRQYGRN